MLPPGSTPDTAERVKVARKGGRPHTANMAVSLKHGTLCAATLALTLSAVAIAARADEIRLKDGKKLYGVIVAYEGNMFKVKTDFGYVLVEKDKIASIVPSTPASETPKTDAPAAKKEPDRDAQPKAEPAVASSADTATAPTNASAKPGNPNAGSKSDKIAPKITNTAVKPVVPANTATNATAPAIKAPDAASTTALATPAAPLSAPREPEVPANREEVQGNLYTNYTHGFRMYKAPSWELIEDARRALPDAVVAMGTFNESTLMVVGQEKTKEPLETAAAGVEKRLHEVYENYRRISQRKTVIGGSPAVEYRYRGTADGHDWSGTLAVISRGNDIYTVLGMTYADSDLIQIQENVIAKAVGSLDFNVH